jgi:hypothetical protein
MKLSAFIIAREALVSIMRIEVVYIRRGLESIITIGVSLHIVKGAAGCIKVCRYELIGLPYNAQVRQHNSNI